MLSKAESLLFVKPKIETRFPYNAADHPKPWAMPSRRRTACAHWQIVPRNCAGLDAAFPRLRWCYRNRLLISRSKGTAQEPDRIPRQTISSATVETINHFADFWKRVVTFIYKWPVIGWEQNRGWEWSKEKQIGDQNWPFNPTMPQQQPFCS